jgi:hypothetical protein
MTCTVSSLRIGKFKLNFFSWGINCSEVKHGGQASAGEHMCKDNPETGHGGEWEEK